MDYTFISHMVVKRSAAFWRNDLEKADRYSNMIDKCYTKQRKVQPTPRLQFFFNDELYALKQVRYAGGDVNAPYYVYEKVGA